MLENLSIGVHGWKYRIQNKQEPASLQLCVNQNSAEVFCLLWPYFEMGAKKLKYVQDRMVRTEIMPYKEQINELRR